MKVYDREGNVIEVSDYNGRALNDQIQYAKVLEKKNAQFRLTPVMWWAAWTGVILGWISTMVAFILGCLGILTTSPGLAWAGGVLGVVLGIGAFFSMLVLVEYHKRHGMPKTLVEKPVELYCKKCQKQLEEELEVANEQRRAELLIELASLGVDTVPALEAARETGWKPPTDKNSDPVDKRSF